jgi:hypothetical protein
LASMKEEPWRQHGKLGNLMHYTLLAFSAYLQVNEGSYSCEIVRMIILPRPQH